MPGVRRVLTAEDGAADRRGPAVGADECRSLEAGAIREVGDDLVADALLFAVPLYNFGVSQHFKTWVDMVITDPRMGTASSATSGSLT